MPGKPENDGRVHNADLVPQNAGRRITVWIYSLAALLIFLSASSLTLIAYMAWNKADRRALESEQQRLTGTLKELHRQIAHDQVSLVRSDRTFAAVQNPVDRTFLENELIGDLWGHFGLDRTFVVSADGALIMQAVGSDMRFEPQQLAADNPVRRLAEQTRSAFEQRQKTSQSAFAEWDMPQYALLDISKSEFAVLDGHHAFLSAVPILPDEGKVRLDPEYPAILVNAIYLDDHWITELKERLSFRDLRFFPGEPGRMHPTNHLIRSADGTVVGYFRWDNAKPGREIWITALPLVVLLAAIISVVAFTVANKISRLSACLEESERKNHHFARHDALTGLPNRHHFCDCLAYCLDNLPGQEFAIFACDLDRFKPVNDTFGHEAGDMVLCSIADRLRVLVGKSGVVSRIGGDEFIILLTSFTDKLQLETLASQIKSTIATPIALGDHHWVEIGVSIGIATAPECGTSKKELIRMADMALYKAKDNGRNSYEFARSQSIRAGNAENRSEFAARR